MAESVRNVMYRAATLRAREVINSRKWVVENYTGQEGCVKHLSQRFLTPPLEVVRFVLPVVYPQFNQKGAITFVENMVREHALAPCTEEFPAAFMQRVLRSYVARQRRGVPPKYIRALANVRFRKADCTEFVWALMNDKQGHTLPSHRKDLDVRCEHVLAS